jgi:hypothetical protein
VTADPVPDDAFSIDYRERAVTEADAVRIEFFFTTQFLKLKAGMSGIALEKPIGSFGVALDVGRKAVK